MPCYNDGLYLHETFASIERQTWKNIEVIVVDDESDDPFTQQQLADLSREGRCCLLTQKHGGPAAARNLAARQASGEYLLPLDADDTIEPDYIEKAVGILEREPRVGACYCHADFFGEQRGAWNLPDYSLREMLKDNVVFVSTVMRREVFEQAGGYDVGFLAGMEDYDFNLTIIEQGWEIVQLPETLFHYRIKKDSRSQMLSKDKRVYYQVYRQLYEKHRALYCAHADEVIPDLRETFLELRQQTIDLQDQLKKNQPYWKRIVSRICRELRLG